MVFVFFVVLFLFLTIFNSFKNAKLVCANFKAHFSSLYEDSRKLYHVPFWFVTLTTLSTILLTSCCPFLILYSCVEFLSKYSQMIVITQPAITCSKLTNVLVSFLLALNIFHTWF